MSTPPKGKWSGPNDDDLRKLKRAEAILEIKRRLNRGVEDPDLDSLLRRCKKFLESAAADDTK